MNHFINFKDFTPDYLENIIDQALEMKRYPSQYAKVLEGKKLYMLFQKTSTRTALSFAFGMTALGGQYLIQNWNDSNFSIAEIQDEVRYVSRQADIIMARLKTNNDINLMAQYSYVPVINGCCNMYHPSQAIADLITIKERFGNLKIKLLYVGVKNNVLNSLIDSLPKLGGEVFAATPVVNEPSLDEALYETVFKSGKYHEIGNGHPTLTGVRKLIMEVDVVYTDTWVDMEFIDDKAYAGLKKERIKKMLPFQINAELLQGSKAVVMHDMPIHAGSEISRDAVENHLETILQQADNRKYAAQSILFTLLK
ncbi:MAG: ornithine carbamoyltransferase [Dehalococcoidales bacterium]